MSARTDALVSQAETGKMTCVHRSPLWPVATRCMPNHNDAAPIWFARTLAARERGFGAVGRRNFAATATATIPGF
jgi:hypothetical protein